MHFDENTIRRFLLEGDECAPFDFGVAHDFHMSASEVLQIEDDLMEDYLEGSLSSRETINFHRNFLVSRARRDRFKIIMLLKEYCKKLGNA